MRICSEQLEIRTRGKGTYEITDQIQQVISEQKIQAGIVTVFVQHTSCSLLTMENAAPAARRDLERFFDKLVPESSSEYEHDDEGPDDMPSHIRSALTQTHLSIPILQGRLGLGTWQGIYVFEHRAAGHRRTVALHALGE